MAKGVKKGRTVELLHLQVYSFKFIMFIRTILAMADLFPPHVKQRDIVLSKLVCLSFHPSGAITKYLLNGIS